MTEIYIYTHKEGEEKEEMGMGRVVREGGMERGSKGDRGKEGERKRGKEGGKGRERGREGRRVSL